MHQSSKGVRELGVRKSVFLGVQHNLYVQFANWRKKKIKELGSMPSRISCSFLLWFSVATSRKHYSVLFPPART